MRTSDSPHHLQESYMLTATSLSADESEVLWNRLQTAAQPAPRDKRLFDVTLWIQVPFRKLHGG
jgi:hypothetical protein